ncbi:hypothetical protein [Niallia sp. FSL W8-1348]|uniref:hypothetical protein n=1 Tax=Niallia sp. FSL W8-1348 TaxID=2954656 RepID=UPI0030F5362A
MERKSGEMVIKGGLNSTLIDKVLFFYRKENPGLCLGFQKAYSVVLKKLPRGAKIFFGSPTENK